MKQIYALLSALIVISLCLISFSGCQLPFGTGVRYLPLKSDKHPVTLIPESNKKINNTIKVKDGFLFLGCAKNKELGKGTLGGFITKIDFDGNVIWEKSASVDGFLDTIYELPNGNGYLVHSAYYQEYLAKYDVDGNEEWLIKNPKEMSALLIEDDGFVAVIGSKHNDKEKEQNGLTICKYDYSGKAICQKNIVNSLTPIEENPEIFATVLSFDSIIKSPNGYILVGNHKYSYHYSFASLVITGHSVAVFVNDSFDFIKQESSDIWRIKDYIAVDDGYIILGIFEPGAYYQLKRVDLNLTEIWSLELKHPTDNNPYDYYLDDSGFTRIGNMLCVIGNTTGYQTNPFIVHIGMSGDILWKSGLLPTKAEFHRIVAI